LLAVDLNGGPGDPFQGQGGDFGSYTGQALDIEYQTVSLSILLPDPQSADGDYGLALSRSFDLGQSDLRLGVSSMHEGGGFVGIRSTQPGAPISADHLAATFDLGLPLGRNSALRLSGSFGVARAQGSITDIAISAVSYNSLNLSYGARDVWGAGDRISLALALPQAVSSGAAAFVLPVSRSNGVAQFEAVEIALAPTRRQLDTSLSYGVPLSRRAGVVMTLINSLNEGNIAGQSSTGAAIGFTYRF
jgi:hypothetical protein